MQDLHTLKQRIQAVKNIRKIADAMKMVSTVKYWRLQDTLHRSRKLCEELQAFIPPQGDVHPSTEQPLNLVLAFFPHRGMCGSLTQNLVHAVLSWYPPSTLSEGNFRFAFFGRKGHEAISAAQYPRPDWEMFELSTDRMDPSAVRLAARQLSTWILIKRIHKVEVVVARFQNLLRQQPSRFELYPLAMSPENSDVEVDVEPDPQRFLASFLPLYFEANLQRVLMECMVCEHASRMTAMDNASKNAGELIQKFRLEYNKIRQTKITFELMEIISGSEALQ